MMVKLYINNNALTVLNCILEKPSWEQFVTRNNTVTWTDDRNNICPTIDMIYDTVFELAEQMYFSLGESIIKQSRLSGLIPRSVVLDYYIEIYDVIWFKFGHLMALHFVDYKKIIEEKYSIEINDMSNFMVLLYSKYNDLFSRQLNQNYNYQLGDAYSLNKTKPVTERLVNDKKIVVTIMRLLNGLYKVLTSFKDYVDYKVYIFCDEHTNKYSIHKGVLEHFDKIGVEYIICIAGCGPDVEKIIVESNLKYHYVESIKFDKSHYRFSNDILLQLLLNSVELEHSEVSLTPVQWTQTRHQYMKVIDKIMIKEFIKCHSVKKFTKLSHLTMSIIFSFMINKK